MTKTHTLHVTECTHSVLLVHLGKEGAHTVAAGVQYPHRPSIGLSSTGRATLTTGWPSGILTAALTTGWCIAGSAPTIKMASISSAWCTASSSVAGWVRDTPTATVDLALGRHPRLGSGPMREVAQGKPGWLGTGHQQPARLPFVLAAALVKLAPQSRTDTSSPYHCCRAATISA